MISTLTEALPQARFFESHALDIDGTPEQVWAALTELRWSDLRVTTPLLWVRRLGRTTGAGERRLLEQGPARLIRTEPPVYAASAAIGRPWQLRPEPGPDFDCLIEVGEFSDPGWLKYGMYFTVAAVADDRTRITTTTLCEPTDDLARRRFTPYWALIRPFSGLIRRDILHAIARRVRQDKVHRAALGQRVLVGAPPRFGLPQYVRAHFTVPDDPPIELSGLVEKPFTLSRGDLDSLPEVTMELDLHCVMTWSVPDVEWTGWRFWDVWHTLLESRVHSGIAEIVFHGLDGARASIPLTELLKADVMIAHSRDRKPLGVDHGAPYRLVIPQLYGYANVKHLCRMELVSRHLSGPHEPWIMHRRGRVDLEERHGLGLNRVVRGVNGLLVRRVLRRYGVRDPRLR